jgi:hypothetical protein
VGTPTENTEFAETNLGRSIAICFQERRNRPGVPLHPSFFSFKISLNISSDRDFKQQPFGKLLSVARKMSRLLFHKKSKTQIQAEAAAGCRLHRREEATGADTWVSLRFRQTPGSFRASKTAEAFYFFKETI